MKVLANHEIEYFLAKASHPPEEGELSPDVCIWLYRSANLDYDWKVLADRRFEQAWLDYVRPPGISTDDDFLISKSKSDYTYSR